MKVPLAATQYACFPDIAKNLDKAEEIVRGAAAAGSNIILFQEMFSIEFSANYDWAPELFRLADIVENRPAIARMRSLSKKSGAVSPVNFFECGGQAYYNINVIIYAHKNTALKGAIEDWSGEGIYSYTPPISYVMTPSEQSVIAAVGCLQAIRSGTTTLGNPFRHAGIYAGAMADAGSRLLQSESFTDNDTLKIRFGDYSIDEAFGQAFLDRTDDLIETRHGAHDRQVNVPVAAHATDNCSPAMLRQLLDRAGRHEQPSIA